MDISLRDKIASFLIRYGMYLGLRYPRFIMFTHPIYLLGVNLSSDLYIQLQAIQIIVLKSITTVTIRFDETMLYIDQQYGKSFKLKRNKLVDALIPNLYNMYDMALDKSTSHLFKDITDIPNMFSIIPTSKCVKRQCGRAVEGS